MNRESFEIYEDGTWHKTGVLRCNHYVSEFNPGVCAYCCKPVEPLNPRKKGKPIWVESLAVKAINFLINGR